MLTRQRADSTSAQQDDAPEDPFGCFFRNGTQVLSFLPNPESSLSDRNRTNPQDRPLRLAAGMGNLCDGFARARRANGELLRFG